MKRLKLFTNILIILTLCTASLYAEDIVVPVVKSPYEITNIQWDKKSTTFSYEVNGTVFKRDAYSLILKEHYQSDGSFVKPATPALPEDIKQYMGVSSVCVTRNKNYIVADGARTAGLYNSQGQKLKTFTSTNLISGFSLSPDEETLIIYDLKNTLSFFNAKTGSYIGYSPKFGTKKIKDVILNSDSTKILVLTSDNSIFIANVQEILYSPESIAPTLKQFSIQYNAISPTQQENDGIVEFNVKEIKDDQFNKGTEYITTTVEKEREDQKFKIEEPKKKAEVTIIQPQQPEQEYFAPSVIEPKIEKTPVQTITQEPEVLESVVTEYKMPESYKIPEPPVVVHETYKEDKEPAAPPPPPPPEVKMITNTVTVKEPQKETVPPTVPVVIPTTEEKVEVIEANPQQKTEPKTEPQQQVQVVPQQTIDLSKILGEDAITYTQGQAPQIIIIQQQPAPQVVTPEQKVVTPVPKQKEEIITQEIIVEVEEIEEPEEETETKTEIKIIEEQEEEPDLEIEPEPEPDVTIIKKKERKQLSEEDKKKLFKDGHGIVLDFEVNKLNEPYNVEVGFNLGYKNYDLIRPFYFGGIIKPFLGFPGDKFPYTYKTETETLKNPYLVGAKIMAPVGFCYYPLKNSFELYAEALVGISFSALWNGSLPPSGIVSKIYPTVDVGAKIGACWDFVNMAFNINYNPITNFTFGVSLGIALNIGGSRIIGGSRVN